MSLADESDVQRYFEPDGTPRTEPSCSALFGVCLSLGDDPDTGAARAYVLTTRDNILKLKPNITRHAVAVVRMENYLRLRSAAQAVIDRWETPLWKDVPATAQFIAALHDALNGQAQTPSKKGHE